MKMLMRTAIVRPKRVGGDRTPHKADSGHLALPLASIRLYQPKRQTPQVPP
jgi:hypothetical protein